MYFYLGLVGNWQPFGEVHRLMVMQENPQKTDSSVIKIFIFFLFHFFFSESLIGW